MAEDSMLIPYRDAAIVPEEPKLLKVGKGFVVKAIPPPPLHVCSLPGFWCSLFSGLKPNDFWICAECGKGHKYLGWPQRWSNHNWTDEARRELENRGLPYPYKVK